MMHYSDEQHGDKVSPTEPVAWLDVDDQGTHCGLSFYTVTGREVPLYTAAPQPQPKQEPVAWAQNTEMETPPSDGLSWVKTQLHTVPLYTAPQPQHKQEPVATLTMNEYMVTELKFNRPHTLMPGDVLYVYTTSQPQQWVGLTDEELDGIYAANGGTRTRRQIAAAIEAKLREKNGGVQ
jgi:hypothetical protein